jgi:transcriptional regulator with XRE-family HTH domain
MSKIIFEPDADPGREFEGPKARAAPVRSAIARARPGAPRPVGFAEGLRELGLDRFGGEAVNLPALEIGEQVRAARQMRGLSQAELATRVGCRQADLSDIELGKGRDGPTYRTLRNLADALNIAFPIEPSVTADAMMVGVAMVSGGSVPLKDATSGTDGYRISCGSFETFEPLLSQMEWKDLRAGVGGVYAEAALLNARSGRYGHAADCYLIHVESAQKTRITTAYDGAVIARVKGHGAVHVKEPIHRFARGEQVPAVAVLTTKSKVAITTSAKEGATFMLLAPGVFRDDDPAMS